MEEKEALEQINEEIGSLKEKCVVYEKKKKRLLDELSSLESDMASLPTEIIDIDKVTNNISEKCQARLLLLEQIAGWEEEIEYAEDALVSAESGSGNSVAFGLSIVPNIPNNNNKVKKICFY